VFLKETSEDRMRICKIRPSVLKIGDLIRYEQGGAIPQE